MSFFVNFVFNQEYTLVSLVCEVCIVFIPYLLNKCPLYFAGTAKFLLMGHVINFTVCLINYIVFHCINAARRLRWSLKVEMVPEGV